MLLKSKYTKWLLLAVFCSNKKNHYSLSGLYKVLARCPSSNLEVPIRPIFLGYNQFWQTISDLQSWVLSRVVSPLEIVQLLFCLLLQKWAEYIGHRLVERKQFPTQSGQNGQNSAESPALVSSLGKIDRDFRVRSTISTSAAPPRISETIDF